MRSLDTNTLLRLLLADVPKQTAAIEALILDPLHKFMVADLVFTELVWVLQGSVYGYDRQQIADNLHSILGIKQINCNRVMLNKAIPLFVRYSKISFTDSCLAVYAELSGAMPLLTFDKNLAAALPKYVAHL